MKVKTEKHTPTPWQVLEDGQLVGNVIETQHSLQVTRIADMERVNRRYPEDAAFIVKAVNSYEALVEFAKRHHEVCEDCEGTGKIYKHADPTTGQWIPCPIAELLGLDGAVRGGE